MKASVKEDEEDDVSESKEEEEEESEEEEEEEEVVEIPSGPEAESGFIDKPAAKKSKDSALNPRIQRSCSTLPCTGARPPP